MNREKLTRNVLPPIVPMVVVAICAEVAVRRGWVPSFLVPAPSSVMTSMVRDWPELWRATLDTGIAATVGFVIDTILAI